MESSARPGASQGRTQFNRPPQSTLVFVVTLLFVMWGSGVVEDTFPMLVSVLPAAAVSRTVIVTVTFAPFARLPTWQLMVPVAPTAGAVHVPAPVVNPTKVVSTGVTS